jgi:hypothetical protein
MAMPRKASAYVDPGSGAMLWQIMAAAFLGAVFYARKAVSRIRQGWSARPANLEKPRPKIPIHTSAHYGD